MRHGCNCFTLYHFLTFAWNSGSVLGELLWQKLMTEIQLLPLVKYKHLLICVNYNCIRILYSFLIPKSADCFTQKFGLALLWVTLTLTNTTLSLSRLQLHLHWGFSMIYLSREKNPPKTNAVSNGECHIMFLNHVRPYQSFVIYSVLFLIPLHTLKTLIFLFSLLKPPMYKKSYMMLWEAEDIFLEDILSDNQSILL